MTDPFNPAFKRALDAMDTGAFRVVHYDLEGDFRPTGPPPPPLKPTRPKWRLRLALRGYDPVQVENLLNQVQYALQYGSEIQRVVARQALRSTELETRSPGYSRGSVRNLFDRLTAQLGGGRLELRGSAPVPTGRERSGRHRGR